MRGGNWVGIDEGQAGGGEHAGLGVDGFAEVLGADNGMVATHGEDEAIHFTTVGGNEVADIVSGVVEEALDAIGALGLQGQAALAFEQGISSPGGAPEEAGGVGAGGHGVEILVELGNADGLSLIHREKQVGGSAEDIGATLAGKELELGIAELVRIALGGFPEAARANAGVEGGFDAIEDWKLTSKE